MITLILVRHGEAEVSTEQVQDKDRRLVKKGEKQMRRVAKLLEELEIQPNVVISSPLLRSYQSAEVIVEELGEDNEIVTAEEVAPDKEPQEFLERLKTMQDNQVVMVVGHEPHLSNTLKLLTGGNVEMKKGAVAITEYDLQTGKYTLTLLVTQKVMKAVD